MLTQIFMYEGEQVRTVIVNGQPNWIAKDVCEILEIGNVTDALKRLDEDERNLVSIEGASNGLPVNAVTESGLYSLILGSKKPEAKPVLVADLAKLLKQNGIDMGEGRLFKYLRAEGYLIKAGSEYNQPTQRSMDLKIMEVKIGYRGSSDGTTKITRTPKITGKGQIYFINKFKNLAKAQ
jgi:phage antirepressor YoqD-like protein